MPMQYTAEGRAIGAPTRSDAASARRGVGARGNDGSVALDALGGEERAVDVVRHAAQVEGQVAVEDDGDLGSCIAEAGESHGGPLHRGVVEHRNSDPSDRAIMEILAQI